MRGKRERGQARHKRGKREGKEERERASETEARQESAAGQQSPASLFSLRSSPLSLAASLASTALRRPSLLPVGQACAAPTSVDAEESTFALHSSQEWHTLRSALPRHTLSAQRGAQHMPCPTAKDRRGTQRWHSPLQRRRRERDTRARGYVGMLGVWAWPARRRWHSGPRSNSTSQGARKVGGGEFKLDSCGLCPAFAPPRHYEHMRIGANPLTSTPLSPRPCCALAGATHTHTTHKNHALIQRLGACRCSAETAMAGTREWRCVGWWWWRGSKACPLRTPRRVDAA
jgi:hypothetical protein